MISFKPARLEAIKGQWGRTEVVSCHSLMVPIKNHPNWDTLLEGRIDCKFGNAAASMLLCRLQNDLKGDPSPAARSRAVDELHAFFTKYERALEAEIKAVFG